MKSLAIAVVLTTTATLLVSLFAFLAISNRIEKTYLYPVFEAMDELQLDAARTAWTSGGSRELAAYLDHLNKMFGANHFLLKADGVDLISGTSRSALLPSPPSTKSRGRVNGQLVVTHRSSDGQYWFVAADPRPSGRWNFFPYYLLVACVTGAISWLVTVGIVVPIRKISAALALFGQGQLSARVVTKRRDEIGGLAQSFNAMAERVETLVTSERRLLEDISHELRSPLARLKLAVRLAKTATDHDAAIGRVERDVNRIAALVAEIIEMTRMEGDPLYRKAEPVQFESLVEETASDCRVEAESRRCHLCITGAVSSEVAGDRELLRRAVENVLRNAIRYSPEDSTIDIRLAETDGVVLVEVRDYGPGVPAESIAKLFEPFFRVDQSRDADTGGVGLGLSIARRALQLHGGTITAQNAGPGLRVLMVLPALEIERSVQKDQ